MTYLKLGYRAVSKEVAEIDTPPVPQTDENQRVISKRKSILKLLYPGLLSAQEKWMWSIPDWNLALSQLSIYFKGAR